MGSRRERDVVSSDPSQDVEASLTRVRTEGMRALRWVACTLGVIHIAIVVATAAAQGPVPLGVWGLCAAEAVVIALTLLVRGAKWLVDLTYLIFIAILTAGGLLYLGFTVGVGGLIVVLCVAGAIFHGRRGGAIAWGVAATVLAAYCAWLQFGGVPQSHGYGTVVVGTPLALRFSVAILTMSGIAAFLVSAVVRGLETTARDLSTALARERDARAAHAASERALSRARSLKSTGRLAGRIAHDLNNVLTPILAHATWLAEDQSVVRSDETYEALRAIKTATDRAVRLTRELQAFSPKGTQARRPIAIDALVSVAAAAARKALPPSITITTKLAAAQTSILGDEQLLHSILAHLADNARDAMPKGGELQIVTRVVDLPKDDAREAVANLAPGKYVELVVQDDGSGMSPEVIDRIYEPFFTTKPSASGLGLASVYGAVQNHGGIIDVESVVGAGTTFHLYFPAAPDQVIAPAPVTSGETGKRALVIDDEEIVRRIVIRILSRAGYECSEATNGREALAMVLREHASLNLVVLDSVMPEMRGEDVLAALRKVDPDLPVLMVSGHLESATADELARDPKLVFLAKPFAPADFSAAVERLSGR